MFVEDEKCRMEHLTPNVIIPQNSGSSHLDEPVYSNVPHQNNNINQYTLSYCNKLPHENNYKLVM